MQSHKAVVVFSRIKQLILRNKVVCTILIISFLIGSFFVFDYFFKDFRPPVPPGVKELYVQVQRGESPATLFETEYYVLPNGPVQNTRPESGETYSSKEILKGKIIPLALTIKGTYRHPERFLMTPLPFYQYSARFSPLGENTDIGSGNAIYRYRLRSDEVGLCFAVYFAGTEKVAIYPGVGETIQYNNLPFCNKNFRDTAIRCVTIASPTEFPDRKSVV